jgi:hypothetical protein
VSLMKFLTRFGPQYPYPITPMPGKVLLVLVSAAVAALARLPR